MSRGFFLSNPKDSKRILTVYVKDNAGQRKKHLTLRPGESQTVVKSPVYIEDSPVEIKLTVDHTGKLVRDGRTIPPQFQKRLTKASEGL